MESQKPLINLKLVIDTKTNRVLFAEASKDLVDFLFFSLSLYIGTTVKLLAGKSIAGSIQNVHNSLANLSETFFQSSTHKSILLNPKPLLSVTNIPLLMGTSAFATATGSSTTIPPLKLYSCSNCWRTSTNTKIAATACTNCNVQGTMTIETEYVPGPCASTGFVLGAMSYMISDDLSVTPMSMVSSISMMNKYNITDLSVLEEREVQFGTQKGLELLKASFQSTTVLTDVFLS